VVDIVGGLTDAYDGVAGAADHAAGSVDESVARQFDDEDGGGFGDFFTADERSDFVFREGTTERTIYDTLFDYEGTWGDSTDTEDLWGPSWSFDGGFDWRNENTDDPTDPDNLPISYRKIALLVGGSVAVLAASYLLGQLFTVGVGM